MGLLLTPPSRLRGSGLSCPIQIGTASRSLACDRTAGNRGKWTFSSTRPSAFSTAMLQRLTGVFFVELHLDDHFEVGGVFEREIGPAQLRVLPGPALRGERFRQARGQEQLLARSRAFDFPQGERVGFRGDVIPPGSAVLECLDPAVDAVQTERQLRILENDRLFAARSHRRGGADQADYKSQFQLKDHPRNVAGATRKRERIAALSPAPVFAPHRVQATVGDDVRSLHFCPHPREHLTFYVADICNPALPRRSGCAPISRLLRLQ